MRRVILLLAFLIPICLFSEEINSDSILDFAESGNERLIGQLFDNTSKLSVSRGNVFLNQLANHIREKFGSEFEFDTLRAALWEIIDCEEAPQQQKFLVKRFFSEIFNESFQSQMNVKKSKGFHLSRHLSMFSTGIRVHPLYWIKSEVPDGVIIGAVETLAGALLWLTPFRAVGTGMMVDGVRRMLNAVEEEPTQSNQLLDGPISSTYQDY
ncbi:MAG: hypothetical protein KR126chlam3_00417 [Chlamydiae bacterium]|nr:hypothetical protein [Chlamydiota bacterium]